MESVHMKQPTINAYIRADQANIAAHPCPNCNHYTFCATTADECLYFARYLAKGEVDRRYPQIPYTMLKVSDLPSRGVKLPTAVRRRLYPNPPTYAYRGKKP